jgi:hypothetical protein
MPFEYSERHLSVPRLDGRKQASSEVAESALNQIRRKLTVGSRSDHDQVGGQASDRGGHDARDVGHGAAQSWVARAGDGVTTYVDDRDLGGATPAGGRLDLCRKTTAALARVEEDQVRV